MTDSTAVIVISVTQFETWAGAAHFRGVLFGRLLGGPSFARRCDVDHFMDRFRWPQPSWLEAASQAVNRFVGAHFAGAGCMAKLSCLLSCFFSSCPILFLS